MTKKCILHFAQRGVTYTVDVLDERTGKRKKHYYNTLYNLVRCCKSQSRTQKETVSGTTFVVSL